MSPPATVRAFIAGASGSGKSTAAWGFYLSRFARRLIVDLTGEWEDRADIVAFDVPEVARALRNLAPRGRWTVAAALGVEQMPDLVRYLLPIPNLRQSPIIACRGAALLVDEVDLIAPPRSLREEVRTLWRRSRHIGLSIIATTQRPEAVSREVSAQSHQALCLHLVEPAGLTYMADIMKCDLGPLRAWWQQHPHGGLWRDLRTGATLYLTEGGKLQVPEVPPAPVVPAPGSLAPRVAAEAAAAMLSAGDVDGAAAAVRAADRSALGSSIPPRRGSRAR